MNYLRRDHPDPPAACLHMCRPFIGRVYTIGRQLPVPAHPSCRCTYTLVTEGEPDHPDNTGIPPITRSIWTTTNKKTRRAWMLFVAYLLRMMIPIPWLLIPLIEEAIAENKKREDMPEPDNTQEPPPQPYNDDGTRTPNTAVNLHPLEMRAESKKKGLKQFHARLIRAGYTRNLLNEPTELFVTPEALQSAINAGQFEGLACFIDHTDPHGHPSIHNLFGAWHNAAYHPSTQAITATLTAYDTDETRPIIDRLDQILSNGTPAPDIGISLVFYPQYDPGTRNIRQFLQVESADIVFFPAADGRILEALSALNQSNGGNHTMTDKLTETAEQEKETAVITPTVQPAAAKDVATWDQAIDHEKARAAAQQSEAWLDEVAQQGIMTILKNSGLPDVVRARLARSRYETPNEVYEAIREAREELQALDTAEVIDLGDRPWIYTKAPEDNIQSHVDWFFGVAGAKAPPSNYRKIDQLYVALTGDTEFHGVFHPDRVMLASANHQHPGQHGRRRHEQGHHDPDLQSFLLALVRTSRRPHPQRRIRPDQ